MGLYLKGFLKVGSAMFPKYIFMGYNMQFEHIVINNIPEVGWGWGWGRTLCSGTYLPRRLYSWLILSPTRVPAWWWGQWSADKPWVCVSSERRQQPWSHSLRESGGSRRVESRVAAMTVLLGAPAHCVSADSSFTHRSFFFLFRILCCWMPFGWLYLVTLYLASNVTSSERS